MNNNFFGRGYPRSEDHLTKDKAANFKKWNRRRWVAKDDPSQDEAE